MRFATKCRMRSTCSAQTSIIHYDRDALVAIFRRNIELERARDLASPGAKDPFERFFGAATRNMRHHFTGIVEPVEEFLWRHTLGRPRDLMLIGERLAQRSVQQRHPDEVRRTVLDASREICRTLHRRDCTAFELVR